MNNPVCVGGAKSIRQQGAKKNPDAPPQSGPPWKIIGIQLDLARRMETVKYICGYADFAAAQGFNTLVLYLEGRVRARCFPFRPQAESYSLEQMQRVVNHARGLGLDVVPVVPALGHSEQFVACRQLRCLAEERDGRGRLNKESPSTFCPSLDETYQFLERYYVELAEVFRGPWWHVGLDESWNLGFCRLCRKRWRSVGLGSIFTEHLHRMRKIVTGLGKRMWLWDDMLEMLGIFPNELRNMPRDVVLCHWQYDENIEPKGIQAHFINRRRWNWLREYERYALDVVICPWGRYPKNIETFTDYARRHHVLGGLLTQWEGSPRHQPANLAVVAFTARLWKNAIFDPAAAWNGALGAVFSQTSVALRHAAGEVLLGSARHGINMLAAVREAAQLYFNGLPVREELLEYRALRMALTCFQQERKLEPSPPDQMPLWDHLEWSARMLLLGWELRQFIPLVYDPMRPAMDRKGIVRQATALRKEFRQLHRLLQKNIQPWHYVEHPSDQKDLTAWRALGESLQPLWRRARRQPLRRDWILILRLFLQDFSGWPNLKVSLTFGVAQKTVLEGSCKPQAIARGRIGGHYDLFVPFVSTPAPDGVILEGWGYGGQGIGFVEVKNCSMTLLPVAVCSMRGPVFQSQAVLQDDSSWAYLGCADIAAAMQHPELATRRGILRVSLKRS